MLSGGKADTDSFQLDGMVIPVTGGARGLGLEMAVAAVEAGAAHGK